MRKKNIISLLLVVALTAGGSAHVFAEEENAKTELVPDISGQVAKEGLFDCKKVQTFDSFMEGAQAVSEMDKSKDKNTLNNVENFVIVKTEKDIAFDTSKVVDAIRYDDIYYIQYETIQDAKDAVEWAVGMQIMGQNTTNLNPAGYANRAEIATMISRFAQTYNM